MTADQQRRDDLKRQAQEFAAVGGYDEPHNRRPGGAVTDRRMRNKKRRARTRAILRAVLA